MKKMLFEPNLKGHRMEYIHHIYLGMINHPEDDFIIVVPKSFETLKDLYEWPIVSNIHFSFIEEQMPVLKGGQIANSIKLAKMLSFYVQKEKVERVFLIGIMGYIPAIVFFISSDIKISGIIYNIYLYRWKQSSWLSRLQDVLKYKSMKYARCIKNVYILNDETAAKQLNKKYNTNKFIYLTDPYNAITYTPHSIRTELGAKKTDKVYLHFGGLAKRKGTLDIIKAISLLDKKISDQSVFVFAGSVNASIRDEFYELINNVPKTVRLIVYDKFCTNEFLGDLCYSCDFILMPYHYTAQSSGILGHAAFYKKTVIGPSEGLIGKLIKRYHLGYTIDKINPSSLSEAISNLHPIHLISNYIEDVTIEKFYNKIMDTF